MYVYKMFILVIIARKKNRKEKSRHEELNQR